MYHRVLPSVNTTFDRQTGFSRQDATTEPQLYYHGKPVQTQNHTDYVYFNHSNTDQNNAHTINPLDEFHVSSLTQAAPDRLDTPVIPESIFDQEYVPFNSVNEFFDNTLPSMLCSYFSNQPCILGNELDICEPTPANHLNSNHHLTTPFVELTNPKDARPVSVVNQLNHQQATGNNPANSADVVDDKSSPAARKRERERNRRRELCQNNPAYPGLIRQYKREYYRNNPAFAERQMRYQRERFRNNPSCRERRRERYRNDTVFAESHRIYTKIYKRMKKKLGKEEASKLASIAKQRYLQSVHLPTDPGVLPQTSNPAELTQNYDKN